VKIEKEGEGKEKVGRDKRREKESIENE